MMELLDSQEVLLANGTKMKGVEFGQMKEPMFILNSPELRKRLQGHKDDAQRERQFGDLILHVLEKIEKESGEDMLDNKDLYPEPSLLDMKKFVKGDVSVSGVSDNSPVFILESVSSKVGQIFHNFNIFELWQLAACTKTELNHIIKQSKGVLGSDLEFAAQDAKVVVAILSSLEQGDSKKEEGNSAWNAWGKLSQATDLLQIKKITNMMGTALSPRNITASIVDVFAPPSPRSGDDDINSFLEM